jgi:hypothetical protein
METSKTSPIALSGAPGNLVFEPLIKPAYTKVKEFVPVSKTENGYFNRKMSDVETKNDGTSHTAIRINSTAAGFWIS